MTDGTPATPLAPSAPRLRPITHGDIRRGDWVDRWLPAVIQPYARLARLDRPIGTWLLLLPGWISAALASAEPPWPLLALLTIGAIAMRGAGCTLNDILDRKLDAEVERTRVRPIPSGQVTVRQALAFMLLQTAIGAAVLLSMDRLAILLGLLVLLLVATYPLMKRVTYWPQFFLGLNFNWGALLAWAAATGTVSWPAVLLYVGGIFWTLGYDTIYAHQDKLDDLQVGIKSSALALGGRTRPALAAFYAMTLLLWGLAGAGLGAWFWAGWLSAAATLVWQVATLRIDDPDHCLVLFKASRFTGLLFFAGIMAARFT